MRFPLKAGVSPPRFPKMNMFNNNVAIPVGFRFHPTDEELVGHYLQGRVNAPPPEPMVNIDGTKVEDKRIIRELDLYSHEPWDLQEVCKIPGDGSVNQNNWYFFSHKDKKYPTGNRANRATKAGFWKATGRDKCIHTKYSTGMRKTLVFYRGRAPHGQKTDWIMHEFRLDDGNHSFRYDEADAWVVCRVFRKTKNYLKSKGEDTPSTSIEEDQQMTFLPELTDSAEKFSSDGGDDGGDVNYPPADMVQNHFNYNMHCKQELLTVVNDYSTPSMQQLDQQVMEAMLPHYGLFRSSTSRPDYSSTIMPADDFGQQMQQQMQDMNDLELLKTKIGTVSSLLSPLPNNAYQTMFDDHQPRPDIRGTCYRNAPAMQLQGLTKFRFHPTPQLDQTLTDVIRPLDRGQQSDLLQASTSSPDMVHFGMPGHLPWHSP